MPLDDPATGIRCKGQILLLLLLPEDLGAQELLVLHRFYLIRNANSVGLKHPNAVHLLSKEPLCPVDGDLQAIHGELSAWQGDFLIEHCNTPLDIVFIPGN